VRAGDFVTRVNDLLLSPQLAAQIAPVLELLAPLNTQIAELDTHIASRAHDDERTRRLMTVPGVGPVTAVAFVATVDRVTRFRNAHQLESYLGLVPREWSSSETQRKGSITKAGNTRMRWLLVEAAWCILRRKKKPETVRLRDWADGIALRRGSHVAAVALARRLAGILYAMWRDRVSSRAFSVASTDTDTFRADKEGVDAAVPVDAKNASTCDFENCRQFSTAPTPNLFFFKEERRTKNGRQEIA
jgi:hypothetical protein